MPAAIVRQSSYSNVGAGTPATPTFSDGVLSANTIIVAVMVTSRNGDPTSIVDNGTGNTYTLDYSVLGAGAGCLDWVYYYRCTNPAGSPTVVTVTQNDRGMKAVAWEVSGLQTTTPLDVSQTGTEAATTTPSYAFTTSAAGQFAAAVMSTNTGGVANKTFATDVDADVLWDGLPSPPSTDAVWFISGITGAAGTYHADGTLSANNGLWDEWVVTYKAAATASAPRATHHYSSMRA